MGTLTPTHQQIVDETLWKVYQRTHEMVMGSAYPMIGRQTNAPEVERLRSSPFGQHLTALALYAEGYPYAFEADVRQSVQIVGRMLFGQIFAPEQWHPPAKFHETDLATLFYGALARFYREERAGHLLTVAQVCQEMNVKRQTVHGWIERGLPVVYVEHSPRIDREELFTFRHTRAKEQVSHVHVSEIIAADVLAP